jgi:hypothetical protein
MAEKKKTPKKVKEAREILTALGLPSEQRNERAALTLLALLDVKPRTPWAKAGAPLIGVTPIMEFVARHYETKWAPNTRETVRRFTMHQFVQAGLAVPNPDEPTRPVNSPRYCYQIAPESLDVVRCYGSKNWDATLRRYLAEAGTLARKYAQQRDLHRIPLQLAPGQTISLTPGGQNELVRYIIEEFCPRFTAGAYPVYVGDAGKKWAHFDEKYLRRLGVDIENHGKIPDVVVHYVKENWLVLIEAVTSHGPVNPKRLAELKDLFAETTTGLVFVTAFLDRPGLHKYLTDIAWETEVWVASDPDHRIHFNGERFLGPY